MSSPSGRRSANLLGAAAVVAATVATAATGSATADFRSRWYHRLKRPRWEPSGATIGLVWTFLYTLTALSGSLLWWRRGAGRARPIWALFALQLALNAAYPPILTRRRDIRLATADSALLLVTVAALTVLAWPVRRLAAALLLPYVAWTAFATFLSATLARLNRG